MAAHPATLDIRTTADRIVRRIAPRLKGIDRTAAEREIELELEDLVGRRTSGGSRRYE
jgi:hypothetical protein